MAKPDARRGRNDPWQTSRAQAATHAADKRIERRKHYGTGSSRHRRHARDRARDFRGPEGRRIFSVAANYGGNDQAAQAFRAETGIPVYKWDVGDASACESGLKQVETDLGPVDVS